MRHALLITVALLLAAVTGVKAQSDRIDELFFEANQAYKKGHYTDAVKGYEKLLAAGYENGHIYYNLGNACFRLKLLGRAIMYYERARILIPRDADLNFNLRHARDQAQDAIEDDRGFLLMAFFWIESLSLKELFWSFGILNIMFWGMLVFRLFRRSEWAYYSVLILVIFWFIAGASFGLKWFQVTSDDRAVILDTQVNILAGPDIKDTALFQLHEGTIVHHERTEGDWSLIHLTGDKRGWVQIEGLGMIKPNRK